MKFQNTFRLILDEFCHLRSCMPQEAPKLGPCFLQGPFCLKLDLCWSHLQVPSRSYFETSRKMFDWKLSSFKMDQRSLQNASVRGGPQQQFRSCTPRRWILEATWSQLGLQYRNFRYFPKTPGCYIHTSLRSLVQDLELRIFCFGS